MSRRGLIDQETGREKGSEVPSQVGTSLGTLRGQQLSRDAVVCSWKETGADQRLRGPPAFGQEGQPHQSRSSLDGRILRLTLLSSPLPSTTCKLGTYPKRGARVAARPVGPL